jgi:hypothetical protein
MSNVSGAPAGDPRHLLAMARRLTGQVRQVQRGTWFPLALLGLVAAAATPFYRVRAGVRVACGPAAPAVGGTSRQCVASLGWAAFTYWTVALVLAYAVIGGFYVVRARRRGVGTRIMAYAIAGVLAGIVLTITAVWPVARHLSDLPSFSPAALLVHGLNPLLAIGLALLVLAWVERLWALAGFAAGYSALALSINLYSVTRLVRHLGWTVPGHWVLIPGLLLAALLLLIAAACFALAERGQA